MAPTKKELEIELKIALKEIDEVKPWFDKEVNAWIFEHHLYPVEYGGDSPEEVIQNYPKYLEIFIEHRMEGKIDSVNEKKTKGKGGARSGAGRPKGSIKEPTIRRRYPEDIVRWLDQPGTIENIRQIMKSYRAG